MLKTDFFDEIDKKIASRVNTNPKFAQLKPERLNFHDSLTEKDFLIYSHRNEAIVKFEFLIHRMRSSSATTHILTSLLPK